MQVALYLSGLSCTNDNFIQKSGAQRVAAQLGIALVSPDTSPRGLGIDGEDDSFDFGTGAMSCYAGLASALEVRRQCCLSCRRVCSAHGLRGDDSASYI